MLRQLVAAIQTSDWLHTTADDCASFWSCSCWMAALVWCRIS